jgi:uncharacterized membrane protein
MFEKLEKLREKPEAYKMRIAFIISVSIAGIIFLVWLSVLGARFRNNNSAETTENPEPAFAEFREEFSDAYDVGRTQFEKTKRELENIMQ